MPDPSTLLLLTCLGCSSTQSDPVPKPSVPCDAQPKRLTQLEQPGYNSLTCVSEPEVFLLSLKSEFPASEKRSIASIAGGSRPQIAPPESVMESGWSTVVAKAASTRPRPILQLGSQGQDVAELQRALKQVGYNAGSMDGIYGSRTTAAVIQFQRSQGLTPDGVTGTQTWMALERSKARSTVTHPLPGINPASVNKPAPQNTPSNSIQPSPPETIRSQSQSSRTVRITPPSSQIFFWIVSGWTIIYIGGWIVILKDLMKEIQGYKVSAISSRTLEAVPPQVTAHASPSNSVALIETQPKQASDRQAPSQLSSHATAPLATLAPAPLMLVPGRSSPSSLASVQENPDTFDANQVLEVIPAEDVFADLVFADLVLADLLENLMLDPDSSAAIPAAIKDSNLQEQESTVTQSVFPSHLSGVAQPVSSPDDHETLIATLPIVSDGETYTYALIEDAKGLFILKNNQLWIVNRHLKECHADTSTITVRRTNENGISVDQSFKLEIKKMHEVVEPPREVVRAVT